MIMDNSYEIDVDWVRQQMAGPSASRGFGGLRGRRSRGSRGSPRRVRRRRGGLMAGDVEHMVVDADWAPHGAYHGHPDQREEYGHMLHDMQGDDGEYDPGSSPSGMFVRKRERTQNWSLQEKLLLFRLVAPRLDVLENRRIDGMSSARKGRAWREIHELFSARYGPERDVFRIREQWRRMKQAAKADMAGKNPQKNMSQSPAAVAVAAAVAAAAGQVHIPPSPALAQSLMVPPTAANLAAQQQQQVALQQQQAAVAAAAAAATATTRNQMNSVLSDMIVKALEKVREREQEGGGPFDLSELDDGMGLGGFFSPGMPGGVGGNQQGHGVMGAQMNNQIDGSHGIVVGNQGALSGQSDNNPSGSVTSSGGSNDAWRLTISSASAHQVANNRVPSNAPDGGQHAMNNQNSDGNSTKVNVKKEREEEVEEDGNGDDDEEEEEEEGDEGLDMVEPDVEMEEGKGTFMIMEMRRREHERRMQIMEREHELRCEVLQVEREAAIIRRETALSERERGWKTLDDLLRCVGATWPKDNEKKEEPLS